MLMIKFESFSTYLIVMVSLITFISSCKQPDDNEPVIPTFPPLTDVIPYEKLSQGKLVFQRIGPMDNAYSGIYVVDITQQKAWGISNGDLDGPAVSPDGKIAVSSYYGVFTFDPDGPDVGSHIYAIKNDGTGLTQVTSTSGITDRSLSWGL